MITELLTIFDKRNSFYRKALVINEDNKLKLQSYDTIVAELDIPSNKIKVNGTYSNTTLRHIKEFLKQKGFKADNKKQIEKDYIKIKEVV